MSALPQETLILRFLRRDITGFDKEEYDVQFNTTEKKHFNFYALTSLNVVTIANPSGIRDMFIESNYRVIEADVMV